MEKKKTLRIYGKKATVESVFNFLNKKIEEQKQDIGVLIDKIEELKKQVEEVKHKEPLNIHIVMPQQKSWLKKLLGK